MELMNKTFLQTDLHLTEKSGIHSGCTAVAAFLHLENDNLVLYTGNVGDARIVLSYGKFFKLKVIQVGEMEKL